MASHLSLWRRSTAFSAALRAAIRLSMPARRTSGSCVNWESKYTEYTFIPTKSTRLPAMACAARRRRRSEPGRAPYSMVCGIWGTKIQDSARVAPSKH